MEWEPKQASQDTLVVTGGATEFLGGADSKRRADNSLGGTGPQAPSGLANATLSSLTEVP